MTLTQTYGTYHFGSSHQLTEQQMHRLIGLFNRQPPRSTSPLDGRSSVAVDEVEGIGPVVVKYYTRGGLVYHVVKRRYLKLGKTRGQLEHELLQKVRDLGINAPQPIVHAYRGHLFYLAWLVTREISQPLSLARLSLQDEKHAREAMKSVIEQISLLIQNNILHVDLHPGNVVVGEEDQVFLVDFDKGHVYPGGRKKLRDRYIARWQRAVIKHRLPEMLGEMIRAGL